MIFHRIDISFIWTRPKNVSSNEKQDCHRQETHPEKGHESARERKAADTPDNQIRKITSHWTWTTLEPVAST